ncbi:hypothetical protein [Streptomyces europaeiscabiei]|uniref:hypothetical protein n=1 Tax=Streptomyces europaeiscabiei TaxID=146819 RepID=UPI0038F6DA95
MNMPLDAPPPPPHAWEEILARSEVVEGIAKMALRSNVWIHRRVDSLEFMSSSTMQWRTTVEFTVPDWAVEVTLGQTRLRLVLIDFVRKQPRIGLDVKDQGGNSVSMLTADESAFVGSQMLSTIARQIVPDRFDAYDLEGRLRRLTEAIDRREGKQCLSDIEALDDRLKCKKFELLAYAFATRFMLLVPITAKIGERRILSITYNEHLYRMPKEGWKDRVRRIYADFGWAKDRYDCIVPQASEAKVYHFEVCTPPGILITNLEIRRRPQESQGQDTDQPISQGVRQIGKVTPEEARLAVRDYPPDKQGVMVLHTLPAPQGWLATSLPVSWLTFAILLAGLLFFIETVEKDTATVIGALLLALNSAIIALLAPRTEHALTRRAFSSLRLMVGLLATLPAISVLTIVFSVGAEEDNPASWLYWAWLPLVVLSGLIATCLTLASLVARYVHRRIKNMKESRSRMRHPIAAIGSMGITRREYIIRAGREWNQGDFDQVFDCFTGQAQRKTAPD